MRVKYYLTSSGRSPVEEFLLEQSAELRADFADAVDLLIAGHVLAMPLSRSLSNRHLGLHELRLKDKAGKVRVLYYIKKGEAIYMLHAFKKKTSEIPEREIQMALRRLREV